MRRPRLNVLRTFEAAGRRLSFSLAAAELNISQAAVSQQMRHLEAYLGDPLFVRHHRRISLTSNGRAYFDAVHEALDRLDTVTDQLFTDRPYQVVTLRCTASVATLWLAPNLREFQTAHPEIDLRIRTLDQDLEAPQSPGSDLEIFVSGSEATGPDIRPLLTSTIVPVAAPGYLADHPNSNQPLDILRYDLIHVLGYEDDWHRWFRTHQLTDQRVPGGLAVDSSLIAIETAIRGDGVILGRRPFVDTYLKSGELGQVFGAQYHLEADYFVRFDPNSKSLKKRDIVANWLMDL